MPNRETRTLSFTPEQSAFLAKCVQSGRFQSASEVVRAALRLLEDQEERRQAELQALRTMIQEGADQLDRGETVDGIAFLREWEEKHRRLAADDPVAG